MKKHCANCAHFDATRNWCNTSGSCFRGEAWQSSYEAQKKQTIKRVIMLETVFAASILIACAAGVVLAIIFS